MKQRRPTVKKQHRAEQPDRLTEPQPIAELMPSRIPEWAILLCIGLVSGAAFLPALSQGFIFDDRSNIIDNEFFRGLDPARLKWMFTTFHMGHYQPLSWITLAIDYLIWGMNPLGYHLTNILLHAANALLVYWLAKRLIALAWAGDRLTGQSAELLPVGAAVAAVIFGIHPMRVESVLWVTERRDVLSSFLTLATIHAYLHAHTGGIDRRTKWLIVAIVIYILSLMSRALGVTLPVILLLLDWFPLRRFAKNGSATKLCIEKVPFLFPAIAAAIVAPMAQVQAGATTTLTNHGMAPRIAQAFYGLVFYVYKGLLPTNLTPLYELAVPINIYSFKYVASAAIVVMSILWLYRVRRSHPGLVVAALCYAITLSPVLGFIQSGRQEVADRYSYLSTIGWVILIGAIVIRYLCRTSLRQALAGPPAAVTVCLIGTLFIMTWRQCLVWATPDGLWRYAVENGPPSAMAHYNFGCELATANKTNEAVEQFTKSLKLNDQYPEAHFNLSNAYQELGYYDLAEKGYFAALALRNDFPLPHYELANVASKRGEIDKAIALYRKALPILPKHARCRQRLAAQLIDKGQVDEADRLLDEAMRLDITLAEAHYDRGRIYGMTGRVKQAADEYRQALKCQPSYPEAAVNLGAMLMHQGDVEGAIREYKKALADEPLHKEALLNLAAAYLTQQKIMEAEELCRKAITAHPDFVDAHFCLGIVLTQAKRIDEAQKEFEQVLKLDPKNERAKKNLEALQKLPATTQPTTTQSSGA
jgi:tetratricopeptide (TPR) repeat protein